MLSKRDKCKITSFTNKDISKTNYTGYISLGGKTLLLLPRTFRQTATPSLGSSSNSCPFHHSQLSLLALLCCSARSNTGRQKPLAPAHQKLPSPIVLFSKCPSCSFHTGEGLFSRSCHLKPVIRFPLNLPD